MKKLFFAAMCCILGMSAKAQVTDLYVTNNTSCDVFVVFRGDVSTNGCNNSYYSQIKQIGAGASFLVTTGNTTLANGSLVLNAGDELVGVEVYDVDNSCVPTLVDTLGEFCYGPSSIGTPWTTYKNSNCNACGTVNSATWTNVGGNTAKLEFN